MNRKPNKFIAAILGLLLQPFAFFYVARAKLAFAYMGAQLAVAILNMTYLRTFPVAATALAVSFALACAIHAYRLAKCYDVSRTRPTYSRWHGLLAVLALFVAIPFALRSFVAEPFRFPSGSMLPSIQPGSYLITQKWGYGNYGTFGLKLWQANLSAAVNRGDIMVFEFPPDPSIHYAKRVVGLPGDTVEYINKRLVINGKAVPSGKAASVGDQSGHSLQHERPGSVAHAVILKDDSPSVFPESVRDFPHRDQCAYSETGFRCRVPAEHYFMMGDNRDNSNDSRYWGFVPTPNIVGKVIHVFR